MFAHNEEKNIALSVQSIWQNCDSRLARYYVIANGCTDNTIEIALREKTRLQFEKMTVIDITIGDKCNAWNTYVHDLYEKVNVHYFCDADVCFSNQCFPSMYDKLAKASSNTVLIAGMPLSGRNLHFYKSLITDRNCFFGNLYGVVDEFVERLRVQKFRLPSNLNWIDSTLTKAVNTDLQFTDVNLPDRTTWIEGCGYSFDSLSFFKFEDLRLYYNRITRYELGKLQEVFLDGIEFSNWPSDMKEINQTIWYEFDIHTAHLSLIKKMLVKKRLSKLLQEYMLIKNNL